MSLSSLARLVLQGAGVLVLLGVCTLEAAGPGYGVSALLIYHGVYTLRLGLALAEGLFARSQPFTAVLGMLIAVGLLLRAVSLIMTAIVELLLMIVTLLAAPFGTIFYLAVYGSFPRDEARALLGGGLALWLMAGVLVLLANPGVLRNRGQVLSFLLGLLLFTVVSVLHAWVPGFLVSILDAIAGIVAALVGAIAVLRTGIALIRPLCQLPRRVRDLLSG